MNVDIALFDFDGTVVDSGPTILTAVTQTMDEMGFLLPPADELRTFLGPPITDGIRNVLHVPEESAAQFLTAYRARYLTTMLNAPVYPGLADVLARLNEDGWTVATASSKREDFIAQICATRDLTDYFAAIGGADPAQARAGKADVIGHVLHLLEASPETDRIIMVGDRIHDVEGAATHSIPTVFVTWGYGSTEESDDALTTVDTATELYDTLTRMRTQPIR